MSQHNNKAIILINLTQSSIGGAHKRYYRHFNEIIRQNRLDYYLVINKRLLDVFNETDGIINNNILIIDLKEPEHKRKNNSIVKGKKHKAKTNKTQIVYRWVKLFKLLNKWFLFVRQFIKLNKKYRFSVVYTIFTGGIWVWPLKYFYRFKLIHSYNDSSFVNLNKKLFDFFNSEYWVLKRCDKIDFLSGSIYDGLKERIVEIKHDKILITPNSFIDYKNFYPKKPKNNSVVFLSRLIKFKNPLLFLESINYLKKNNNVLYNKIDFILAGDGLRMHELIRYKNDNNLSKVKIIGKTMKPWEILSLSSVFISIQETENYPSQSLIEAMACENAIIASDVGETRRLVTESEGVLVKLNKEEIVAALEKLFTTPGLIEELGRNARKRVLKEHTVEKFTEYFYSITN